MDVPVGQAARATGQRRERGLARREAIEGYLFILPWLVGLVVFTGGPFLAGFALSLTDYSALQVPHWVGLQNYAKVFHDDNFYLSIGNTVYYVVLSVPLGMLAGFSLA